jgi:signal transduction histidine kinase
MAAPDAADAPDVGAGAGASAELAARLVELEQALTEARQAQAEAGLRAAAAEAADEQRTRFFASASHDLRQPLQALSIFVDRLVQTNRDSGLTPLIDQVAACVAALDTSFTELLDLASIDLGAVAVRMQPCEVAGVYARVELAQRVQAFDKGLALSFRGGRHRLHADPVLLERVLSNLVANAIRYTDDGGVLVSCRRRGERYALQVWDSGVGMSATAIARVFDEFYQVGGAAGAVSAAARSTGLGLGLAIVRRLVALMGLTLDVRSRVGQGSVFTLWLNGAPASAEGGAGLAHLGPGRRV